MTDQEIKQAEIFYKIDQKPKTYEELQICLNMWGNQLGSYNEGCGCGACLDGIKKGFNDCIDYYKKLNGWI